MASKHIKFHPPRPLTDQETTHTLSQWKINFRQFCKKDDSYKHFLKSDVTWNPEAANYGFRANVGDTTPAQLKDDLEDFLYMLASYLPHGFLTDKILKKSTSFNSAFKLIEEHFGLLPSQETFCDFSSLTRAPNEPYRQFFDRMLAFLSQHLMPHKVAGDNTVDGTAVPVGGDKITVTMMNMVAMMWLDKIHPELLGIIRTEYSKELRDNIALSQLVPRNSMSIDALLAKYEKVPAINKLSLQDVAHGQDDHADVYRLQGGRRDQGRGRQSYQPQRGGGGQRNQNSERNFCSGCFYLGRQVNAVINYKHLPGECPRRPSLIQLLEAEDADFNGGNHLSGSMSSSCSQITSQEMLSNVQKSKNDPELQNTMEMMSSSQFCINDFMNNKDKCEAYINRLANETQVAKSKSPSLWMKIHDKVNVAIIDEGAEVTAIDHNIAKEAGIAISNTNTGAKAAGAQSLSIIGQSLHPVTANVLNLRVPVTINLGHCLIIKNLGTPVLIGQPTKISHKIVTLPHLNQINFEDIHNVKHTIKYPLSAPSEFIQSHACKIENKRSILYPGDELIYKLPQKFKNVKHVSFSPRPLLQSQGLLPCHLPVQPELH